MAISIGTVSSGQRDDSNALTFAHTVDVGTTILVVGVSAAGDEGAVGDVNSVTWNGTPLTKLVEESRESVSSADIWYKLEPASGGPHNIVITMSNSTSIIVGGAICVLGSSTNAPTNTASDNYNSTTSGCTVAGVVATSIIIDCLGRAPHENQDLSVAGADQTQRYNRKQWGDVNHDCHGSGSTQSGADGGAMTWTHGWSHWAIVAVEIEAPPAPQTITLDTLTLAGSAPSLDVAPGAISVVMDDLTLAGSVPALSVEAQVSLLMDELTLAGSVPALTVDLGPPPGVALDTLTLAGSVPSLVVIPGEIAILLDELTLAGSVEAVQPAIDQSVILDALTLAGSAEALVVVPGEIAVVLDTLTLVSSAEELSALLVIGVLAFTAGKFDFVIEAGADWRPTLWLEEDGKPRYLAGYKATMHIRERVEGPLIKELKNGAGITIVGDEGKIQLELSAEETSALQITRGVYDLKLTRPITERVTRLLEGSVIVKPEVTQ